MSRTRFLLTIDVPEPHAARVLRQALKALRRRHGVRAVRVELAAVAPRREPAERGRRL